MSTSLATPLRLLVIGLLTGLIAALPGHAQPVQEGGVPRNSDAELMFDQGVAAFDRGDYQKAAERFRLVNDYRLNQKTTAAFLMQGKALLRLGRYEESVNVLSALLNRYPQTSYRDEAREVIKVARSRMQGGTGRVDTLRLGIALPMNNEYVGLTQAMFNGIRLAVDEHNGLRRRYIPPPDLKAAADTFAVANTERVYGDSLAQAEGRTTVTTATDTVRVDSLRVVTEQRDRPDRVAKMHFRPIQGGPEAARATVDSLARLDEVDVVIGPLFSTTARAAGAAAEEARVPLVAPLATDESVAEGREYVFQANPPIRLRGRLMARFAAESLLMDAVSFIYERGNTTSEQMVKGFREEARQQDDLRLPFELRLDNARQWSRLPEALRGDTTITDSMFAETEALYLPIAGRNASGKIQDALTGLSRLRTNVRVLGNSFWHNLSVKTEASSYTATYANDFNVDTKRPEVQHFIRRYRMLTGDTPGTLSVRGRRLAYTGYDIAQFLLTVLSPLPTGPDPDDLRTQTYEGLGIRINFQGGNVNRAMFFHRYRNGRIELIR